MLTSKYKKKCSYQLTRNKWAKDSQFTKEKIKKFNQYMLENIVNFINELTNKPKR